MKRHFKSKTTDVGRSVIVSYIFFAIKGAKKKQHNHLPNPYIERNLIHLIAWVISRNYIIFLFNKKIKLGYLIESNLIQIMALTMCSLIDVVTITNFFSDCH